MIETIIVGIIVAVALFFSGRSIYRTLQGKEKCSGCSSSGRKYPGDELLELLPPSRRKAKVR